MALKLMYITNDPEIAQIAENAGVDRIFVDMEYIGKSDRQGGMDTVQSHHTISDIKEVKKVLKTAELLVRVNPIHQASESYCSSQKEIEDAIVAGADILMLPYFKTADEVKQFIKYINSKAKAMLLFETPEAVANIDEILSIPGIDEAYIGLNDLSLGYGLKFMFELLSNGTVERMCLKFKQKGIPYGFGGIASLGKGMLPAEYIIKEHYRLGSTCAILSRSFCNTSIDYDIETVVDTFNSGLTKIRDFESECEKYISFFSDNEIKLKQIISGIINSK